MKKISPEFSILENEPKSNPNSGSPCRKTRRKREFIQLFRPQNSDLWPLDLRLCNAKLREVTRSYAKLREVTRSYVYALNPQLKILPTGLKSHRVKSSPGQSNQFPLSANSLSD